MINGMKTGKLRTLTQKAVEAMNVAIQGVVDDHRRRNQPLAIWQDGKVVLIHLEPVMSECNASENTGDINPKLNCSVSNVPL